MYPRLGRGRPTGGQQWGEVSGAGHHPRGVHLQPVQANFTEIQEPDQIQGLQPQGQEEQRVVHGELMNQKSVLQNISKCRSYG